ncbi:MAG: MTH1187 family thiamine-binding protein [Arcobacteraceae bacterium]
MTSVLLEFSMFPTDKGESKSEYVSKIVEYVRSSGYVYQLTPMATIIETNTIDEAFDIVKNCYKILDEAGCNRVYSILKFDIRKNKQNRMKTKIDSIVTKIGDVNK